MFDELTVPFEELLRVRRHLHAHPELSLEEHETARYILSELASLPFENIRTGIAGTGILLTLQGGRPGPVSLLRADMDALPLQEEAAVPFRSTRAGVMHACGHDGHVSILVQAAKTLARMKAEIPGTLVFCFQPAEERGGGNRLMIEAGALEHPHVDRTFALHLYSSLEVGKIGIRNGPFFSASDRFVITLNNQDSSRAGSSEQTLLCGAYMVTSLQSIVSREMAPQDPVVLSICQFQSPMSGANGADCTILGGTIRCFNQTLRTKIVEQMRRILTSIAKAFAVDCVFEHFWGYPATINDPSLADLVRNVGDERLSAQNVIEHDAVMWSEDMGFMQEQRPGAYFLVGAMGDEHSSHAHHSQYFSIDERALAIGYTMMVGIGLAG